MPPTIDPSGAVDHQLLVGWSAVLARVAGGPPPPRTAWQGEVERVGADLLRRWREPHRRYHNVEHLVEVLAAIDLLAHSAREPDLVRLAAWFHDAVYEGRPGQDEAASAELAEQQLLALEVPPATATRVRDLVLSTAHHQPDRPGTPEPRGPDPDAQVLCDADLAILAAPAERYCRYRTSVRHEYRHLADDEFRAGRRAVLQDLADRQPLYLTPTGRALWEEAARRNLAAELTLLGACAT